MKGPLVCNVLLILLPAKALGFIPPTATTTKTIPTYRSLSVSTSTPSSSSSSFSSSSPYPSIKLQTRKDIGLYAFWDRLTVSKSTVPGNYDNGGKIKNKTPFVIDRIVGATKQECDQISSLIIKVFFEEEAERKPLRPSESEDGGRTANMTPWKAIQLAYLKNMQNGDMRGKIFAMGNKKSDMFVARRVVLAPSTTIESGQTVDISEVFNAKLLPTLGASGGYIREDVIGFVDISEKNFGLASEYDLIDDQGDGTNDMGDSYGNDDDVGETTPIRKKSTSVRPLRPVLTNLAVSEGCRCSNVGSELVEACEDAVLNLWGEDYGKFEIILEVEEENKNAQRFYEKRGYKALFADPSTRRYDASGFFLNTVRTTKICYRKDLRMKRTQQEGNMRKGELNDFFGSNMFQMVRDVVEKVGR